MALTIDTEDAAAAIRTYNRGMYGRWMNVAVDRRAYERFASGLPSSESDLIDCIRFVGEDYGGAQRRFLPHDHRSEAKLIVARLLPQIDDWMLFVNGAKPLLEEVPDEIVLGFLMRPFEGSKRWPVWASKTLHFIRPDVYPIIDSKAKVTMGLPNLGGSPKDYQRWCVAVRETVFANPLAMNAARLADDGQSPSELKLLDKILYQMAL